MATPGGLVSFDQVAECCRRSAAEHAGFRFCLECASPILRCSTCGHAATAMGGCDHCLSFELAVPVGKVLEEGGQFDLPLLVRNRGPATVRLLALHVRSGPNRVRMDLRSEPLATAAVVERMVHLSYPGAGQFALEVQLEVAWQHAARIGLGLMRPEFLHVRARRQGPLVDVRAEGLGSLVSISGSGMEELLRQQLVDAGARAETEHLPFGRASCAGLADCGDQGRMVSWRTELAMPDLLDGGAERMLRPQPWQRGIVLGRNRPGDAATPDATDACLRFPGQDPHVRERSMVISRSHWRLFPARGHWELEQLGATPTELVLPEGNTLVLQRGSRNAVPEGSTLCVPAHDGARLRLRLKHTVVEGTEVRRSALQLVTSRHG